MIIRRLKCPVIVQLVSAVELRRRYIAGDIIAVSFERLRPVTRSMNSDSFSKIMTAPPSRIFLESPMTLRLSFDYLKIIPSGKIDFPSAASKRHLAKLTRAIARPKLNLNLADVHRNGCASANVIRRMTGTNRDAPSTLGAFVACPRAHSPRRARPARTENPHLCFFLLLSAITMAVNVST